MHPRTPFGECILASTGQASEENAQKHGKRTGRQSGEAKRLRAERSPRASGIPRVGTRGWRDPSQSHAQSPMIGRARMLEICWRHKYTKTGGEMRRRCNRCRRRARCGARGLPAEAGAAIGVCHSACCTIDGVWGDCICPVCARLSSQKSRRAPHAWKSGSFAQLLERRSTEACVGERLSELWLANAHSRTCACARTSKRSPVAERAREHP